MKVCLVYPKGNNMPKEFNGIVDTQPKSTLMPLGMLYIVSNSPSQVDFIDNRILGLSSTDLFEKLVTYDVVGFGGTIFEVDEAILLGECLKGHGVTTFYGGANANVKYKEHFDHIVFGEADRFDFNTNKSVVSLPRIKDLNSLNYPSRLNIEKYNRKERWLTAPTDTIVSSRGCPFSCTFCNSSAVWGARYTSRTADSVIGEVKHLQSNYGTKSIYFREDNFLVNKKRLKEFCNIMPLEWSCEGRVDSITEETARIMVDGGCKSIMFGIEHTCNNMLGLVDKHITYEKTVKALEICEKYGIKTIGSFIAGLPQESIKDLVVNFIRMHKLKLDHISINRLFALPRTQMWNDVVEKELDSYRHGDIILPRTELLNRHAVDLIYYLVKKYFAVKEKYL